MVEILFKEVEMANRRANRKRAFDAFVIRHGLEKFHFYCSHSRNAALLISSDPNFHSKVRGMNKIESPHSLIKRIKRGGNIVFEDTGEIYESLDDFKRYLLTIKLAGLE